MAIDFTQQAIDFTAKALVKIRNIPAPIEAEDNLTDAITYLERSKKRLLKTQKEASMREESFKRATEIKKEIELGNKIVNKIQQMLDYRKKFLKDQLDQTQKQSDPKDSCGVKVDYQGFTAEVVVDVETWEKVVSILKDYQIRADLS